MICSFCHKEIKKDEYIVKCSKCGKIYHSPCWVKNLGCATPNCKGEPSKQIKFNPTETPSQGSRYNPKGIKINRCPVCKKIVLNGEPSTKCPFCETVYHQECWNRAGGCILNCTRQEENFSSGTEKTCPYCMMPITRGEEVFVCPKCNIPHHKDCWEENGGCTTYGCPVKVGDETAITPQNNLTGHLAEVTGANQICPYCQTEINSSDEIIYCEQCNIPHHRACWEENNGCTTYGCNGRYGSTATGRTYIPNEPPVIEPNYNQPNGNLPPQQGYPPPPQKDPCLSNGWNCCVVFIILYLILNIIGGCNLF